VLTRDLIRASVRKDELRPSLIDPDRAALRDAADELYALWHAAADERWRRGELDEALAAWIGDRSDHKILRGLAKVASDASTFEVHSPLPPVELRARVFREAKARGPLALEPGPLGRPTADDVLADVAAALGCAPDDVREAMYADLRDQERLVAHRVPDGRWLLDRYNVALVQTLLLSAVELRVTLHDPSMPRLRQLLRLAKFHQLMVRADRDDRALTLTFDGPANLFAQSTRYGMELARFLPTVLLQECAWDLEATVLWTKARHEKRLRVDSRLGLRSHAADTGAWQTREQEAFLERFHARDAGWVLDPTPEPIPLGDRAVLVPDFTLVARDGRRAHLEIVGYWTPESLAERLERLRRYGPGTVIVAVSRRRNGSKTKALPPYDGELVPFAEVVPVADVLAAAERIAR
jgi:uncharacterized protein